MTPEGKLKKFLREECAQRGLHTFTLRRLNYKGWPDNCVMDDFGCVLWLELKTDDADLETETAMRQKQTIAWLQNRYHKATMCVGKEGIMNALQEWVWREPLEVVTR